MKKLLFLFLMASVYMQAQSKIYLAGSGIKKIICIDQKSQSVEWEYPLEDKTECNTVDINKKGEIVFSYKTGARLISTDKKTIWDYPIKTGEMQGAFALPDGGYLLAHADTIARIIELDAKGKERKVISYNTGIKNIHNQFRQIKKSKKGTYLVPLLGKKCIVELDSNGKELKTYELKGGPFSVLELPNGNLLASEGDGKRYTEIDTKTGASIRSINNETIGEKGIIQYAAQAILLKSGNLLLCNWNGHFKKGETKQLPHLIEIDKKNNVVWTFSDHQTISRVSTAAIRTKKQ